MQTVVQEVREALLAEGIIMKTESRTKYWSLAMESEDDFCTSLGNAHRRQSPADSSTADDQQMGIRFHRWKIDAQHRFALVTKGTGRVRHRPRVASSPRAESRESI